MAGFVLIKLPNNERNYLPLKITLAKVEFYFEKIMEYIKFLREYSKEIAHLLIILKCSVYLDRSYAEFNFGVGLDRYVGIFIMF